MTEATIRLPPKLVPVFTPPRGAVQYRGARGGRGSGKSFSFAKMAAIFGYAEPLRILCTREFQASIKESFHAEVKAAISSEPWLEAHVAYEGEDCLIWPFQHLQDSGVAAVKYKGKQSIASRVMCEMAHGKPPTEKHEAAHSCGKGHLGCVNPKHLRWATRKENLDDMIAHGTRLYGEKAPSAKLTEADVRAIRAKSASVSQAQLGREFAVRASTIGKIIHRQRWSHI